MSLPPFAFRVRHRFGRSPSRRKHKYRMEADDAPRVSSRASRLKRLVSHASRPGTGAPERALSRRMQEREGDQVRGHGESELDNAAIAHDGFTAGKIDLDVVMLEERPVERVDRFVHC